MNVVFLQIHISSIAHYTRYGIGKYFSFFNWTWEYVLNAYFKAAFPRSLRKKGEKNTIGSNHSLHVYQIYTRRKRTMSSKRNPFRKMYVNVQYLAFGALIGAISVTVLSILILTSAYVASKHLVPATDVPVYNEGQPAYDQPQFDGQIYGGTFANNGSALAIYDGTGAYVETVSLNSRMSRQEHGLIRDRLFAKMSAKGKAEALEGGAIPLRNNYQDLENGKLFEKYDPGIYSRCPAKKQCNGFGEWWFVTNYDATFVTVKVMNAYDAIPWGGYDVNTHKFQVPMFRENVKDSLDKSTGVRSVVVAVNKGKQAVMPIDFLLWVGAKPDKVTGKPVDYGMVGEAPAYNPYGDERPSAKS